MWKHSHALFVLRSLGLAALVVAFARPQTGVTTENVNHRGIDIVLARDLSTSMLAEDLELNRIETAKAVAADPSRTAATTASAWWCSPATRSRRCR